MTADAKVEEVIVAKEEAVEEEVVAVVVQEVKVETKEAPGVA